MHFLLLVLRFVLDRLIPAWRGSSTLAARADGRLEHVPTRCGLWDRWLSHLERNPPRLARRALAVRAVSAIPLAHGDGPANRSEPQP
jgi:hypothetical protein